MSGPWRGRCITTPPSASAELKAISGEQVLGFFRDNATVIIALLALIEGGMCAYLINRNEKLHQRLYIAQQAAEDAARAAALAAPGGIDPEAVIQLLRSGQPATLDNVYALMERTEKQRAAEEAAQAGVAGSDQGS